MTSDGQALLQRCLLLPCDATARLVFADWLGENDEPELEAAMRGERGEEHLITTRDLANRVGRFPCLKFLWGVVLVYAADHDVWRAGHERAQADLLGGMRAGTLVTLPDGAVVTAPLSDPARRSFLRRMFGG